jgi:arylsulfatase A
VPFIIRWPGKVKPGKSAAMMSQIDFIASFASLLGIELEPGQAIDSRDMLPALLGKDPKGLPYMIEEARGLALRKGPWKFIPGGKPKKGGRKKAATPSPGQLYNLDSDPGEQNNVIEENKDLAGELRELLEKLRNSQAGVRAEAG